MTCMQVHSSTPHKARKHPRSSWQSARLNSVRVIISHGTNIPPFGLPSDQKALPRVALGVSLSTPTPFHSIKIEPALPPARLQAHPVHRNMPELPPTLLCRGPDLAPETQH